MDRTAGAQTKPEDSADPSTPAGTGWAGLALLAPVVCCGGPFLVGALATAGAVALGALGAGLAVVVGLTAFLALRRRRALACCAPPQPTAAAPWSSNARKQPSQ
jgi:hypothetical protein